jgi:hypothetical protein
MWIVILYRGAIAQRLWVSAAANEVEACMEVERNSGVGRSPGDMFRVLPVEPRMTVNLNFLCELDTIDAARS